MTDFISPAMTPADVVRRAARINRDLGVMEGHSEELRLQYWDALNDVLQSLARMRAWPWLDTMDRLVTRRGQSTYNLRAQAKAVITCDGYGLNQKGVTINSRTYLGSTNGLPSGGDVDIDLIPEDGVGGTPLEEEGTAQRFVAGINADTGQEDYYAVETAIGEFTIYWLGDDGASIVVTEDSNSMTTDGMVLSMPDFSSLTAISRPSVGPLSELPERLRLERGRLSAEGTPTFYCLTGDGAQLQLSSAAGGYPDDSYEIVLGYSRIPSQVMPDGRGSLWVPMQFHDLLPRAVATLMKLDEYDPDGAFGHPLVERRIQEMLGFQADQRPIANHSPDGTFLPSQWPDDFTTLDPTIDPRA